MKFQITFLGVNSLFGRVASGLLRQSPVVQRLQLYDDNSRSNREPEFSYLPSQCEVCTHQGRNQLQSALEEADIVVIGDEHESSDLGSEAIASIAWKVIEYCHAFAHISPKAVLVVAASPMNTIFPLVSHVLREHGCFDGRRVLGATSVDTLRANTLYAAYLRLNPSNVILPVVGGTSPQTRVPVFSQAKPCHNFSEEIQNKFTSEIKRFDLCMTEEDHEPNTIERAYAAVRLLHSIMAGLGDEPSISEMAMAKTSLIPEISYFSLPIDLGIGGIERTFGLPELSSLEEEMVDYAVVNLNRDCMRAQDLFNMYKPYYNLMESKTRAEEAKQANMSEKWLSNEELNLAKSVETDTEVRIRENITEKNKSHIEKKTVNKKRSSREYKRKRNRDKTKEKTTFPTLHCPAPPMIRDFPKRNALLSEELSGMDLGSKIINGIKSIENFLSLGSGEVKLESLTEIDNCSISEENVSNSECLKEKGVEELNEQKLLMCQKPEMLNENLEEPAPITDTIHEKVFLVQSKIEGSDESLDEEKSPKAVLNVAADASQILFSTLDDRSNDHASSVNNYEVVKYSEIMNKNNTKWISSGKMSEKSSPTKLESNPEFDNKENIIERNCEPFISSKYFTLVNYEPTEGQYVKKMAADKKKTLEKKDPNPTVVPSPKLVQQEGMRAAALSQMQKTKQIESEVAKDDKRDGSTEPELPVSDATLSTQLESNEERDNKKYYYIKKIEPESLKGLSSQEKFKIGEDKFKASIEYVKPSKLALSCRTTAESVAKVEPIIPKSGQPIVFEAQVKNECLSENRIMEKSQSTVPGVLNSDGRATGTNVEEKGFTLPEVTEEKSYEPVKSKVSPISPAPAEGNRPNYDSMKKADTTNVIESKDFDKKIPESPNRKSSRLQEAFKMVEDKLRRKTPSEDKFSRKTPTEDSFSRKTPTEHTFSKKTPTEDKFRKKTTTEYLRSIMPSAKLKSKAKMVEDTKKEIRDSVDKVVPIISESGHKDEMKISQKFQNKNETIGGKKVSEKLLQDSGILPKSLKSDVRKNDSNLEDNGFSVPKFPELQQNANRMMEDKNKILVENVKSKKSLPKSAEPNFDSVQKKSVKNIMKNEGTFPSDIVPRNLIKAKSNYTESAKPENVAKTSAKLKTIPKTENELFEEIVKNETKTHFLRETAKPDTNDASNSIERRQNESRTIGKQAYSSSISEKLASTQSEATKNVSFRMASITNLKTGSVDEGKPKMADSPIAVLQKVKTSTEMFAKSSENMNETSNKNSSRSVCEKSKKEPCISGTLHNISQQIKGGIKGSTSCSNNTTVALGIKNSKNKSILANLAAASSKQESSKTAGVPSHTIDNEKSAKSSVQKVSATLGDELARKETRFGIFTKRNEPIELKSTNVNKVQGPKKHQDLNDTAKIGFSNKSEFRNQVPKMIKKAKSNFKEAGNSHSEMFAQRKGHLKETKSQIIARNDFKNVAGKTSNSFQNEKTESNTSIPNINAAVGRSKNVEQVQKMRNSTVPTTENDLSIDAIHNDISLLTEKLKETQSVMENLMYPIQPNVKEWKNCIMENLIVKDTVSEEPGKSKSVTSAQNEDTHKEILAADSEPLNKDQTQPLKDIGNANTNSDLALSRGFLQKIEQSQEKDDKTLKDVTGGVAKKATASSAFDKTANTTTRMSNVPLENNTPKNIHDGNTVLYKYVRELNAKMEQSRTHEDNDKQNDKGNVASLKIMKSEKNKKTSITVNTLKEKIRRMQEKKRANTILERISNRIGDISVESRDRTKTPAMHTNDSENTRPKRIDSIVHTDEYIRRAKHKLYMTKELYKNKNKPKLNYKTADEYYKHAALRNIGEKTAVRTLSNDSQRNSSPSNSFTESYFTNKIKSKKPPTLTTFSDKGTKFPKEKFRMTNILKKVERNNADEVRNITSTENKTDVFGVKSSHSLSSQQVSPEDKVKKNYSSNDVDKLLCENFKMNENSKGKEQSKLGSIQNEDMKEKVASVSESNLKKCSNQQLDAIDKVVEPDKVLVKSSETSEPAKSVTEYKGNSSSISETNSISAGILAKFVGNMTDARNKELTAEVREGSLENIELEKVAKLSEKSTKPDDKKFENSENTMESRQVQTQGKETSTNAVKTESTRKENYSKNTNIFVANQLDKTEGCPKPATPRSIIRYKYLNYSVNKKRLEKRDMGKLKPDFSGENFTNKNVHRSEKLEKKQTLKVEPPSRREKKAEIRKTKRTSTPKTPQRTLVKGQGNVTKRNEGNRKDESSNPSTASPGLPFKPVNMSFKTRTREEQHYAKLPADPRRDRALRDSSMGREQGAFDQLALYNPSKDKTTERGKNVLSNFPMVKRKESSNSLIQGRKMETSDRKEQKKPSINTSYRKWSPTRLKESQAKEAKLQQTKRRDEALVSINEKYSLLPKRQKLTPDLYMEYMKSMRTQFPKYPKTTYSSPSSQRFSPAPIAAAKAQEQSNMSKQATSKPKVTKSMPFASLSAVQTFKESHKKSDSKAPFQLSTGDILPKETALPLQQYKHFSHQKKSPVNVNTPKVTQLLLKNSMKQSQPKSDPFIKSNISKIKQISDPELPIHLKPKYMRLPAEQAKPSEVQSIKSSSGIRSADKQGLMVGMPRKTYNNLYGDGCNEKSPFMYSKTVSYPRLPRVKMSPSKGTTGKEATKKIHLLKNCDQDDSNNKPKEQPAEVVQNNVRRNDLPEYHPSFPLSKPKKYQERFARKSQSFMKKWEQIIDMFQNVMSPDKKQRDEYGLPKQLGEPVLNIDQKCEIYENENSCNTNEGGSNTHPQSDVKSFAHFRTLSDTYDKLRHSKSIQDYSLQDNPNQAIPKKQLYPNKDPPTKIQKNKKNF